LHGGFGGKGSAFRQGQTATQCIESQRSRNQKPNAVNHIKMEGTEIGPAGIASATKPGTTEPTIGQAFIAEVGVTGDTLRTNVGSVTQG
jgi:hypothetical protein